MPTHPTATAAVTPVAPTASVAEDFAATQTANYSKWVAKVAIDIDGARAFNAGDPVPDDPHIKNGIVSRDLVVGANTKTAAAVTNQEG